jgi:hypothetical protein
MHEANVACDSGERDFGVAQVDVGLAVEQKLGGAGVAVLHGGYKHCAPHLVLQVQVAANANEEGYGGGVAVLRGGVQRRETVLVDRVHVRPVRVQQRHSSSMTVLGCAVHRSAAERVGPRYIRAPFDQKQHHLVVPVLSGCLQCSNAVVLDPYLVHVFTGIQESRDLNTRLIKHKRDGRANQPHLCGLWKQRLPKAIGALEQGRGVRWLCRLSQAAVSHVKSYNINRNESVRTAIT